MSLLLDQLTLASSITVQNPCLVITQLATSNSANISESLNDDNEVLSHEGGTHHCNFQLGVFASEQAVTDKLPPIDTYREGRHVKVFQLRLDDEAYVDLSPREAAYAYLLGLPEFAEATTSKVVDI